MEEQIATLIKHYAVDFLVKQASKNSIKLYNQKENFYINISKEEHATNKKLHYNEIALVMEIQKRFL